MTTSARRCQLLAASLAGRPRSWPPFSRSARSTGPPIPAPSSHLFLRARTDTLGFSASSPSPFPHGSRCNAHALARAGSASHCHTRGLGSAGAKNYSSSSRKAHRATASSCGRSSHSRAHALAASTHNMRSTFCLATMPARSTRRSCRTTSPVARMKTRRSRRLGSAWR
jgi:hypothetical protein